MTMADLDRLLDEYRAALATSRVAPDPAPYLDRAGPEREALAERIDALLADTPRRAWDADAFQAALDTPLMRELATAASGVDGLWPALLPRLRNAARIRRRDLVARLAAELGVADREEKVARYYHQMERGLLDERGVSDRVLDALGRILGVAADQLREAGRALSAMPPAARPGFPGESTVFARTATPDERYALEPPSSPAVPEEPWDEVDELFAGRRE